MRSTRAYATSRPDAELAPVDIERRDLGSDDVAVHVTYCGVCHTDLHAIRALPADGAPTPLVPGHEFVGTVTAAGADVTSVQVGDTVAVGNIVDSCGDCAMCLAGQENFCDNGVTLTYGGRIGHPDVITHGAFASEYVVRDRFVYRLPADVTDVAALAPVMCAGITVWEPLRRWRAGPGVRVGVVGLGGLGHLAVRLAHALGAEVTAFTSSAAKQDEARRLGADHVVVSTDDDAMSAARNSCDLIIDCVPVEHDLAPYLNCVALDGTLCVVGHLGRVGVEITQLLVGRKSLASAGSGGVPATRELLDFCLQHDVRADIEVLPSAQVNTALARLADGDVRYRFVLDLADLA